ncbi:MAG TPA: VTT domain-containing protein [Steroidobacter sp.]|nr:VTT domain-containing protein [Steroidobacter sp.]
MAQHAGQSNLFDVGRNCWRLEHAARAAFLIDADAYFRAFVTAARNARRSILVAGWDFHSRTRLLCAGHDGPELELGEFLNELVRRRRGLHIHILVWDYPMVFGLDREWAALHGLGWKPHHRVHFRYDNTHPVGGSHHQKIVVIDDTVAFSGGIDLTSKRWDTCEHSPLNELRVARGDPYPPFHDLMMLVEGEAARALGDLLRERWREATGRGLRPPQRRSRLLRRGREPLAHTCWPDGVAADVTDVEVAISRTQPGTESKQGVHEVEALYLDMIRAARRSIYIENQYFTAHRVGDALAARLQEEDGPEIVVVLREMSHGWLEEMTMQTLRTRLIEKLQSVDGRNKFAAYYPYVAGLKDGECIDVHAKLMIIDDDIVRIGSANLANRSMGLDTECDLTIAARGSPAVSDAIRTLRAKLLAEHLGCDPARVHAAIAAAGSVHGAIKALRSEQRTLRPLETPKPTSEAVLNMISVADPERPGAFGDLVQLFHPENATSGEDIGLGPAWGKIAAIVLLVISLTALWKYTPLAGLLDGRQITDLARRFAENWWAPLLTMLAYTPAALMMFPRPLITLFAVVAFGPVAGFIYAMLGVQLAAWATFVAGRRLKRTTVRRVAGDRLNRILEVLRHRGLLAIAALRLVPLAPFAVGGLVAGAVRVKPWRFLAGTAIGVLPGTLTSTVFGDQFQTWLQDPGQINYWLIALALFILGAATWLVRRWLVASTPPAARHGVGDARAI